MSADKGLRDYARILLALIRLFNGLTALLVPAFLARQVGVDPVANPGALYAFRMFGVRTVLLGAELLIHKSGPRRDEALRRAVLIHASDTVAAFLATQSEAWGKRGKLIVFISATNTVLAIIANR